MYIQRIIWNITYTYNGYTIHIPSACTHLDIFSPESMAIHVEWVTPGAHNPAIQIWLEFYCLEGVNVDSARVRHDAGLQNSIECCCTPGLGRVRSGWHIQVRSNVVCNPLSQFLGKKLQHGMAATVHDGCCLAGLAGCADTPRNCCFSSIMSSPGAECPWRSINIAYQNILVSISK